VSEPPDPGYRERLRSAAASASDLLAGWAAERWEFFTKGSAIRQVEVSPGAPPQELLVDEVGVAVRTVRAGRAGFASASGLDVDAARRAVEGAISVELELPFDPLPPPHLLSVGEAGRAGALPPRGWASHVTDQLQRAVTGRAGGHLRLRRAVFHEGTYSWMLTTGDGFLATHEDTATSMVIEVQSTRKHHGLWREWVHIPDPEAFDPDMVAGRITDRALLDQGEPASESGLANLLLSPETAASLLAAMVDLVVVRGPGDDLVAGLLDRDGRLASDALTLVDDRLDGRAPITGPCDGEGLAARRTLLLERGVPRHRLASFRDAMALGESPLGGALRLSYRDYPATGIANLKVATEVGLPSRELLERAGRALYLLRPLAPVLVDVRRDSYRIVASGVWLDRRNVRGRQPVVELAGSLSTLLRRIEAVGNDADWFQTERGCVSAPSILIRQQKVT
jgi:PmbA protein